MLGKKQMPLVPCIPFVPSSSVSTVHKPPSVGSSSFVPMTLAYSVGSAPPSVYKEETMICLVPIRLINQAIIDLWMCGHTSYLEEIRSCKPHGGLVANALMILSGMETEFSLRKTCQIRLSGQLVTMDLSSLTLPCEPTDLAGLEEVKRAAEAALKELKAGHFRIYEKPESLRALIRAAGEIVISREEHYKEIEKIEKCRRERIPDYCSREPDPIREATRKMIEERRSKEVLITHIMETQLKEEKKECSDLRTERRCLEWIIQECNKKIRTLGIKGEIAAELKRRVAAVPW